MTAEQRRVTVRADSATLDQIDALAARVGISRSDLLRDVIAAIAERPPAYFPPGPLPEVQVLVDADTVDRAKAKAKAFGWKTLNAAVVEAIRLRIERSP